LRERVTSRNNDRPAKERERERERERKRARARRYYKLLEAALKIKTLSCDECPMIKKIKLFAVIAQK